MTVKLLPPLDMLDDRLNELETGLTQLRESQEQVAASITSLWEYLMKLERLVKGPE